MRDGRLGMLVLFLQAFVSTVSAEVATRVVRFTHGDMPPVPVRILGCEAV